MTAFIIWYIGWLVTVGWLTEIEGELPSSHWITLAILWPYGLGCLIGAIDFPLREKATKK